MIQYGLGPIGIETAKPVLRKTNMKLVGAVDISKDIAGKDLGEILGTGKNPGEKASGNAKALFRKTKAAVVLHTADSRIPKIYGHLVEIIGGGPRELHRHRRECPAGADGDHRHTGSVLHAMT